VEISRLVSSNLDGQLTSRATGSAAVVCLTDSPIVLSPAPTHIMIGRCVLKCHCPRPKLSVTYPGFVVGFNAAAANVLTNQSSNRAATRRAGIVARKIPLANGDRLQTFKQAHG